MGLFKRKKKQNILLDESFDKVIKEIENIDDKDNPRKIEHYILDSCEHIISTAKEVDNAKGQYDHVSGHLRDVEKIENIPEDVKNTIRDTSEKIVILSQKKQNYRESDRRISDDVFMLLQEHEDDVVNDIHRMEENERYLSKIESDIRFLEGQKSRQEIDMEDILILLKRLRIASVVIFVAVIALMCAYIVMPDNVKEVVIFPGIIAVFIGVLAAFLISLLVTRKSREYRKVVKKLNQSINLLNVERMKYVNVNKALNFELKIYEVKNSTELIYLWEQYMMTLKEQEAYRKNNIDLTYYADKMYKLFKSIGLKYERKWIEKVDMLLDENRIYELKTKLLDKRAIIKRKIDESNDLIRAERVEMDRLMREYNFYVPEVMEIIRSVDKFCAQTLEGITE